ncbi:MAG: hypothetical protein ACOCWG_03960 [bacterium]
MKKISIFSIAVALACFMTFSCTSPQTETEAAQENLEQVNEMPEEVAAEEAQTELTEEEADTTAVEAEEAMESETEEAAE